METNKSIQQFYNMMGEIKDKLLSVLPSIILSLIVLLAGYLIGRVVKYLVIRFIRYLHGLLIERVGGSIQFINLGQSANFLGTAFFWLVLISTFVLISDILGLHIVTSWMERVLQYAPNLLAAILIISVAVVGGRAAAEIISAFGNRVGLTYGDTLGKIVQYLLLLMAIVIAIDQTGIEVAILINIIDICLAAILFAAALTFALGAKTEVSNILATFYVRKKFKMGDQVKIGDVQGKIARIDNTFVVIEIPTGQVIIPSKSFSETQSFLIKPHE